MCTINFSFDGCRPLDFKIVIYECSKILKRSSYIKNVTTQCGYACGFKPPKYVVLSIRKLNWCTVCKYVAYCIESSLYTWVFNFFQMNEGRKSQIVLPDERRLDLLIQVSNHLQVRKLKQ